MGMIKFSKSDLLATLRDNYIRYTLHWGGLIVISDCLCLRVNIKSVNIDLIGIYYSRHYVCGYGVVKEKTDLAFDFIGGIKAIFT